jgi:acetylornithine deacetylase/succinyl-diaminopimelate desuccinylase-like protein
MEPFKGVNAGTHMLNFLSSFSNHQLVKFGALLHEDYYLNNLKVNYEHQEMGVLTCNIGIIDINKESSKLTLDMRYPTGFDKNKFEDALKECKVSYQIVADKDPHYIEPTDPLITTLYDAYVKYTNDLVNKPRTIGGGTYARAIKKGVAFGMEMPGAASVVHQPNEYLIIEEFLKGIAIYAEAIYQLGK